MLMVAASLQVSSPGNGQTPPGQAAQTEQKQDDKASKQEIVSRDVPAAFKVRVNVVLSRVVVRDAKGQVVANLKKEDFQLTDNGKPQAISSFSVESPSSQVSLLKTDSPEVSKEGVGAKATELPRRFITLFFDDSHLSTQDVPLIRQAALKVLTASTPGDRFSIFTTSGQVDQDFTTDHAKLEDALQRIVPRPLVQNSPGECPPMSLYEAHMIVDVNDADTLRMAVQDYVNCSGATNSPALVQLVESFAGQKLSLEEAELQRLYQNLYTLIRRMSTAPGQRVIVMISPGFFVLPAMHQAGDLIDSATKANIVINAIDPRGLFVSSLYDASGPGTGSVLKQRFVMEEESQLHAVLAELADGTGGLFFHNRNDIDEGLRRFVEEPEVSYVLGFSPQNLKLDGKYHHLKVTLANQHGLTLQARHGYYAPRHETDPVQAAREEVRDAIFTSEELKGLSIDCQTQFFSGPQGAHMTVLTRLDGKGLKFRKAEDRNNENLTISTAIFDENGHLLMGQEKLIDLSLKDATLERVNQSGLTFKSTFDLQSGTFIVRVVVRDSEGEQMGATNRSVVIP
jgi:VWFA-related protein